MVPHRKLRVEVVLGVLAVLKSRCFASPLLLLRCCTAFRLPRSVSGLFALTITIIVDAKLNLGSQRKIGWQSNRQPFFQ